MPLLPDPLGPMIARHRSRLSDPVERLRFVLLCSRTATESTRSVSFLPLRNWFCRLLVLDALSRASRSSGVVLNRRDRVQLWIFRRRTQLFGHAKFAASLSCLLLVLAAGLARGPQLSDLSPEAMIPPEAPAASLVGPEPAFEKNTRPQLWLVETDGDHELYSNGLRVSNEFLTHTGPRSFPVFARGPGSENEVTEWRGQPAGIVYHASTTEWLAPLERSNNQLIRFQGKKLLHYIQKEQYYNFVIDRFGRVYRIVPETEYAHHAGFSVWAEGGELFVNLNQSFIGVSLETRGPANPGAPPEENITPAQLSSSRLLTEMLRNKFGIAAANCVTHEMISINPRRMLIGHHTDWGGRFPFETLGLPDNYEQLMPSLSDWGFSYDTQFVQEVGGRVWPGVRRSQERFNKEAALRGMTVESYRNLRRRRFEELLAQLEEMPPPQTWSDQTP